MGYKIILLLIAGFFCSTATKAQRPNIIVFLVDDMGIMDTSVPFCDSVMPLNKRYHTPNMQRLANQGVKFVNAYAQPVCTPTRVSLLTGMNASSTKITNWISPLKNNNTDAIDEQFDSLGWNINGLSQTGGVANTINATVFPQLLKEAGYFTVHVGKAHWGSMGTPGASPNNLGFMVNIAGHAAGHPQSYLSEQRYGNMPGKNTMQSVPDLEAYFDTGTFLTEALTLEAEKALEEPIKRKIPFFLNMAHYAVHVPFMADNRYVDKYLKAGLDKTEAMYASLIEGMDKSLGDLMDFLEKKDVAKNTIIFFMSDNGGLYHVARGQTPNGQPNYPFRSGKGSVYEGGIHLPMIVKWPGVAKPGTVNANPVIIDDFMPSILEMAQVKTPAIKQKTNGQSLVPILKYGDKKLYDRPLVFHFPNKWTATNQEKELGINYYSAMRYGKWKLIYRMRDQSLELYDLSKDIGEKHNLASALPAQTKKLANILGKTLKLRGAQMPFDKITKRDVPYPGD